MIGSAPVELARDEAARLAREELAKQVYRDAGPGLVQRVVRLADRARGQAASTRSPASRRAATPGSRWSCCSSSPPSSRCGSRSARSVAARPASRPLFSGRARTAAEHRAAADAHAAAGEWAEAVRERLRAVVRSLEERAVLDERPGRTADEAAAEAGVALPAVAAELRRAARLFDDIWYGGRPAGPESDAALRGVDEQVRAARPGQTAGIPS